MLQVVQNVRTGATQVTAVPDPELSPGQLVVANTASLISAGTERYVVELAKKSLIGKARERPDHVRRVLQKMRQEGVLPTLSQVRAKLDEPMPLGYSTAGVVVECGRSASDFKVGDRVATCGPHAGVIAVSRHLCAKIPDNVTDEQAAYTGVAAIALQGIRLIRPQLGERVVVLGLGLLGQIAVALLKANGCRVFGIDLDPSKLELAKTFGADRVATGTPADQVRAFSDGFGADAVLITAATTSNTPIEFSAQICRPKGRIILVGTAGLNIPRPPFFEKELEFSVSFSVGPGRTDPNYEDKGIDYPIGHTRWTAQRNLAAVLDAISMGHLPVEKLTSHKFAVEQAGIAYDLVTQNKEPYLGIVLTYADGHQDLAAATRQRRIELKQTIKPATGELGLSMIGAGNFARLIMMPIISRLGGVHLRGLCTARGLNAVQSGQKMGFDYATTETDEVWRDPNTHLVMCMTRHNLHATQVIDALRAGKHVFVEKPLCITLSELSQIRQTVEDLGATCPMVMVGLNRRFAPATSLVRKHFGDAAPLNIMYRFSAGPIPANAWPQDDEVGGGRIIGEACHAIDTCVALTNSVPVSVYAESITQGGQVQTSDDSVHITLRHENGSVSTIIYVAHGDKAMPPEYIEIFGGGKSAQIANWDKVTLWKGETDTKISTGKDRGHAAELEQLFAQCRRGGPWPIPWEQLYAVALASLFAVRSLRHGMPVRLDQSAHEHHDDRANN